MNPFAEIRDAIAERIRRLQVVSNPPGDYGGAIPVLSFQAHKLESKLKESIQSVGISVVVREKGFSYNDRQALARFEVTIWEKPIDNHSKLGASIDGLSLAFNICATLEQFKPSDQWSGLHNLDASEPSVNEKGLLVTTITMQTVGYFRGRS